MYVILCLLLIMFIWMLLLHRELKRIGHENETKRNNQAYYFKRISQLKEQIHGKEKGEKTETD